MTNILAYNGAISLAGGATLYSGAGSPSGVVSAPVGSIYLRTDGAAGASLYVKEVGSGNTGWSALNQEAPPAIPALPLPDTARYALWEANVHNANAGISSSPW